MLIGRERMAIRFFISARYRGCVGGDARCTMRRGEEGVKY